ncbi:hypothetical protein HZH66_009254 [Vespula vulgaris]|uniref:Uncharacterized protein n=1 Tax=Vespula vulgaris TaxID=7454 RepID=A0A834JM71_VESVU|nr:hypothetical protein HZH66_009254 [Vespula vulgaris]
MHRKRKLRLAVDSRGGVASDEIDRGQTQKEMKTEREETAGDNNDSDVVVGDDSSSDTEAGPVKGVEDMEGME